MKSTKNFGIMRESYTTSTGQFEPDLTQSRMVSVGCTHFYQVGWNPQKTTNGSKNTIKTFILVQKILERYAISLNLLKVINPLP